MTLCSVCPQAQRHVSDLYEDLRDGHNLISLLEVLSGDTLVSLNACITLNESVHCLQPNSTTSTNPPPKIPFHRPEVKLIYSLNQLRPIKNYFYL